MTSELCLNKVVTCPCQKKKKKKRPYYRFCAINRTLNTQKRKYPSPPHPHCFFGGGGRGGGCKYGSAVVYLMSPLLMGNLGCFQSSVINAIMISKLLCRSFSTWASKGTSRAWFQMEHHSRRGCRSGSGTKVSGVSAPLFVSSS